MYINVNHYNSALQSLINSSNQIHLCSANPLSYSDVNSLSLGDVSSIPLSILSYENGQKIVCGAFNISITSSGSGNILVIVGGGSIQAKIYIEPVPVTSGESISISGFDLWKMENPSF